MDGCPVLFSFRHHEGRAAGEHQHDVSICFTNRVNQRLLTLAQLHMLPIHTLRFQNLVQTHTQQNGLRVFRQFHGFRDKSRIRCRLRPGKALGKARHRHALLTQTFHEIVQACGIDLAGAGALIPGHLGKVADDGHAVIFVQRENPVVVQQDNGAFGAAAGNGMVGIGIEGLGCL